MLQTAIIGASGYTGTELAKLLVQHPHMQLQGLYVSQNSADANKYLNDLDGKLSEDDFQQPHLALQAINDDTLATLATEMDLIFLATPHEASHDWMPTLLSGKAKVLDLSGAFRLAESELYESYYGFPHQHETLLQEAVYGLVEWNAKDIANASLVAVPGCYPTASLLALKPLMNAELLDTSQYPIINAVSGVSGAGRKATLGNSFCEVSLQAYGVLGHRHQPEIASHLGTQVIFTPHLGNFKRGILATITAKLNSSVSEEQISDAFQAAYAQEPLVKLSKSWPKLDDVVHSPQCHLHWKYDASSNYIVVTSAIDNLLKGAASQALQCANLVSGYEHFTGLINTRAKTKGTAHE